MFKKFKNHLEQQFPELLKSPFLLACSGGIDSIVLTHLCHRLGLSFCLAHCNFQLRGDESRGDEEFVRKLTESLNKKYFVKNFETEEYILLNKVSVQEGARMLRYRWFDEICHTQSLDFIVTAHHADDALETFIMHLSRGAGLSGLTGIPHENGNIRRPLLPFNREEIRKYAAKNSIVWRDDRSNADTSYFRNKIRHELIPQLNDLHPAFLKNFRKSIRLLKGSHKMLQQFVEEKQEELVIEKDNEIRYSIRGLELLDPLEAWIFELFSPYGFKDWESIIGLLNSASGKIVVSPTHQLLKDRTQLILKPISAPGQEAYEISEAYEDIKIPITLNISEVDKIGATAPHILYIDKETLNGRLHVRKWQKGDYFYPLGMKGRKLVSKYFKDQKFNKFQKEAQWLLCAGKNIVWVIGHRADERFKVGPKTSDILKIEYRK